MKKNEALVFFMKSVLTFAPALVGDCLMFGFWWFLRVLFGVVCLRFGLRGFGFEFGFFVVVVFGFLVLVFLPLPPLRVWGN